MSKEDPFRYKPRRKSLDVNDMINGRSILDVIASIAAYRHSQPEAAALLGVGTATFKRFLHDCPEARDAWRDGRQMCKATVRRLIFVHAKSDPATARYLANNILDMTPDGKTDDNVPGGTDRLSREDAMRRIQELQGVAKAQPSSTSRALVQR